MPICSVQTAHFGCYNHNISTSSLLQVSIIYSYLLPKINEISLFLFPFSCLISILSSLFACVTCMFLSNKLSTMTNTYRRPHLKLSFNNKNEPADPKRKVHDIFFKDLSNKEHKKELCLKF